MNPPADFGPMRARRLLVAFAFTTVVAPAALAQDRNAPEALLDKMTGHWVMTGTMAKKPTTHDVDVEWVLKREYIRIHEVSRDKDASGGIGYEAWIYVVWDAKTSEYAVMWLDNTAATNFAAEGIGHARPDADRIPFIFKDAEGSGIHTTFAYDRATDAWSWTIDNVDKSGKASPFAKVGAGCIRWTMADRRKPTNAPPTVKESGAVNQFRPHPWHGLDVGPDPPAVLNAYIEITPFDLMKYEVDKVSGYLRVDRPQRSSAQHPTLYGFVPRTYCGDRVCRLAPAAKRGDGDPLDICVLSERAIARNEIIVRGRVIGGLQMIDGGEADDKIISVLENDYVWGEARNISHVPSVLVERLQHYFLTYKLVPGQLSQSRVASVYGRVHALKVVRAAMADYVDKFAP